MPNNRTTIILSVRDNHTDTVCHYLSDGTCIVHSHPKPNTTHIDTLPSHYQGLTATDWTNIPKRLVDKIGNVHLFKVDQLPSQPILAYYIDPYTSFTAPDGKFHNLTEARTYYHHAHSTKVA